MEKARPLAMTIGEPAGIGPDIALAAWLRRKELDLPVFYLIAETSFMARRAQALGWEIPITTATAETAASVFAEKLPVASLDLAITALPAHPDGSSAPAAIAAIRRAVDDVMAGRAAAIVTNPVAKAVLYRAGFPDPGHTEYLGRLTEEKMSVSTRPVMMIWSTELAVVPVTVHLPLQDVAAGLSTELIIDTARIVARDLSGRFGIARPRIAVAGLNPHAGEDGTLGGDDSRVIAPAIRQLVAEGLDARGPFPADTMFHAAARARYDVALCMYHDQALIPVKTLAFDHAVNVTLGLPFVRTSPDHGTAFAVAGSGRANPTSLIEALRLAARIASPSKRVAAPLLSRA
jgi:4-hydroxythreonine-4-phosphate dehydrogenase